MDYKAVIEEQIKTLQRVQEMNFKRLEARHEIDVESACLAASTIEHLCSTAFKTPSKSKN